MKLKWNWRNYMMEFVSIFFAVLSAFALNNWNDNRRDTQAANKILLEISNGLEEDLEDIKINIGGHEEGVKSCQFWRQILSNEPVNKDSLMQHYLALTRDFFSAQNNSGYETLKSKGLELLRNDSLRYDIISLYEYDYESLKTMEENYFEMQFQENYFRDFNKVVAPNFVFNEVGNIVNINTPLNINVEDKNILMAYLWKIQVNRDFILRYYSAMEEKLLTIKGDIDAEINRD